MIKNQMSVRLLRFAAFPLGTLLLLLILAQISLAASYDQDVAVSPTRVTAFLYPPYPGIHHVSAIFDHHYPNYGLSSDEYMIAPNGRSATCTPAANQKEQICAYNDPWTQFGYNDHDGIDYAKSNEESFYVPVYAAANASRVIAVGWYNPQYHDKDLGLRVILGHDLNGDTQNDYYTYYGHLSAISLPKCGAVGDPVPIPTPTPTPQPFCLPGSYFLPMHGDVIRIRISGNTGSSSGPHLHFTVRARYRGGSKVLCC